MPVGQRTGGPALDFRASRDEGAPHDRAPEVKIPLALPDVSGDNVVVFARPRAHAGAAPPPEVAIDAQAGPAGLLSLARRQDWLFAAVASLLIHGALYFALNRPAQPLPSAGLQEISVDIVLENNAAAQEPVAEPPPLAQETQPTEPEVSTAPVEETPPPIEQAPSKPLPPQMRAEPRPPLAARAPVERRVKTAKTSAAPPSRSTTRAAGDPNYYALVAAHLAREKRYPADARSRGERGSANVSFAIDGSGRVTRVVLARGTGFPALDQEVRAMVYRASPFPAPPGGRGMSFTVPVSFRIQ